MLSDAAKELAYELRLHIGSDKVGIGPELSPLMGLVPDMEPSVLAAALRELEGLGFVRVDRAIATQDRPEPRELRGIVGVTVLEPLQAYFDRLRL